MSITITLTDPSHIFGVEAAAAAASTDGNVVLPQDYARRVLEQAAESWAKQFGFVKAEIPLDRAMAIGEAKAEWNATAPDELKIADESDLSVKAAQFALANKAAFETFLKA